MSITPTMKRIKRELDEKEITQAEFSRMLGVSQVTAMRWLKGIRQPGIDDVERMAAILGLKILVYKP